MTKAILHSFRRFVNGEVQVVPGRSKQWRIQVGPVQLSISRFASGRFQFRLVGLTPRRDVTWEIQVSAR